MTLGRDVHPANVGGDAPGHFPRLLGDQRNQYEHPPAARATPYPPTRHIYKPLPSHAPHLRTQKVHPTPPTTTGVRQRGCLVPPYIFWVCAPEWFWYVRPKAPLERNNHLAPTAVNKDDGPRIWTIRGSFVSACVCVGLFISPSRLAHI